MSEQKRASGRRQLTTFFLRGHYFGIDVRQVQEVLRRQPMTRVPTAPPVVAGLINLRGQIVTALDLRRRLGLDATGAPPEPTNLIVQSEDGLASLLVDEIGDVIEVDDALFEPPPATLQGIGRELIRGAYKLADRLLLILDVDLTVGGWADGLTRNGAGTAREGSPR
jgi:purine-binding chemotaxis protein CheW